MSTYFYVTFRSQSSCTQPPFIEFDMSAEGFGCLYLPSIAPQSANLNALGTQDTSTLGGIGSGSLIVQLNEKRSSKLLYTINVWNVK